MTDGVVETESLKASVDARTGLVTSLVDKRTGRELVSEDNPFGQLVTHQDIPNKWEAWDINNFYKEMANPLQASSVDVEGDRVVVIYKFGRSSIIQTITAEQQGIRWAFDVDWHEQHTLLKWYVPVAVKASEATSEIQFGHLRRPTHTNTSWDQARFETAAQRWVHVAEGAEELWVANSSTYGWGISAEGTDPSHPVTRIGASLLRGPVFPAPEADQGRHHLEFLVGVGEIPQAIEAGYSLNLPLREIRGSGDEVAPIVVVDNPGVVVEAVKLAEDESGDVVVRLYESEGRAQSAAVTFSFDATDVRMVNLLEQPLDERVQSGGVSLDLHPFEIVTLRAKRG